MNRHSIMDLQKIRTGRPWNGRSGHEVKPSFLRCTILDRYFLAEISIPFLIILGSLTLLLQLGKMVQLMDLMVNKGVRLIDVIKLLLYLMPNFLIFTMPVSFLISLLIGLGRMSTDNEIVAMKSAGISLYRILYPATGAAMVVFLATLTLSVFLVHQSNASVKNLLFAIIRQNASIGIQEKVFNDNFKDLLLFAHRIPSHGRYMEGVIISDNRSTSRPSTIFAEKAYLVSDKTTKAVSLRLENGSTHMMDLQRQSYRKVDFTSYSINLDMDASISGITNRRTKDSTEMSIAELASKINMPDIPEEAKRELAIELHKKFALPLTSFIFAILGVSLGVSVRKSARSRGVTVGIAVMILYYLLQLLGNALTETGAISPWLGTWFPNGAFLLGGLYLLFLNAEGRHPGFTALSEIHRKYSGGM